MGGRRAGAVGLEPRVARVAGVVRAWDERGIRVWGARGRRARDAIRRCEHAREDASDVTFEERASALDVDVDMSAR